MGEVVHVALQVAEHDEGAAPGQLGVLDVSILVADHEMLGDAEGVGQPLDGAVGVFVTQ